MNKFTEKEIEIISNCAAFGYDYKKIAIMLNIEENEVKQEMLNKNSELSLIYEAAKIKSEYLINTKLHELALQGDIKALEYLKKNIRR